MFDMFTDRIEAGRKLGKRLHDYHSSSPLILAIPMGGVPVAYQVAKKLQGELDLVIPRKLPIPWNPEAGFGAMTIDGNIVLNHELVEGAHITKPQVNVVAELVLTEIQRRNKALRGDRPPAEVEGRTVIIVDDGLASGYTMLAGIRHVRAMNPAELIVAVPVASAQALRLVSQEADKMVCLVESPEIPFAVAGFYITWKDLTDQDVKQFLEYSPSRGKVLSS